MKSKGFSRKRYVFHRLVNDKVVQKLSYCMFAGQQEFTIQFGFEPLCSGDEIEVFMDDYRLGSLMGNESLGYLNTGNPDALRESLEMCQQYLFSYFDMVVDYESFLNYKKEIIQKELAGYDEKTIKRVEHLYLDGLFLQDMDVYHISLITGAYEMAKKSREALIKYRIGVHIKNWGVETHPIPEEQKKFEKIRDSYYRIKLAIDENDRTYIEEYIAQNEKHAVESYIRNFYGKRAFNAYQNSGKLPFVTELLH